VSAPDLAWVARRGSALRGEVTVPGDKSVSHRAVMLAALAEGSSSIEGFLEGEDTRATAAAFAAMGVRIEAPGGGRRIVHGVGLHGLAPPQAPIDCGNAGTGMRLLAGVLAGQAFDSVLVGDASLSRRPMGRVIAPLSKLGARIDAAGGLPPLHVHGGQRLVGAELTLEVASAQVKSAILLAGLYARGETVVHEPRPTRDYTERMLAAFGWPVEAGAGGVRLTGGHALHALEVRVPADFSSAAFFVVAATLVPGSDLLLTGVGLNPRRTGLLEALSRMGADIRVERPRQAGGEAVGDLRVRHARLRGIDLQTALVADMIDEFPVFFVAAALAEGDTRVHGAHELRVKESDRISAMAEGLRRIGVAIEERPDGALIQGSGGRPLGAAGIDSRGDHRIAMAFAVAGQMAMGELRIGDCANVATSFPGFSGLAASLGFGLVPASPAASPAMRGSGPA
jgi:3-phosphoshikimate 1-carboxyvinyltransferase